jgi:lambda family phage portal protein
MPARSRLGVMLRSAWTAAVPPIVQRAVRATWTALSNVASAYDATDPRRKTLNTKRPPAGTANQLLLGSLPLLRAWSRDLERRNPTARAGVEALKALVVGTGIALEPATGDERVDAALSKAWKNYIRRVSVDGRDLYHLQSLTFAEVVVAGEGLWRFTVDPALAAAGQIPVRTILLESEWICGTGATGRTVDGVTDIGGVLVDKLGRAVSYRLQNPDFTLAITSETVPAAEVAHIFEPRRAMQSRGEPWYSPLIERLSQEGDLISAELQAAVTASSLGIVITSQVQDPPDTTVNGTAEDPAHTVRLGGVARLYPGESIEAFSHNRPSQAIAPFRATLRGDIAAALRIPQRYLDRDVSRANYSSMRADMLDTDRLLAPVREWFGHATAGRLYREVLPYLAIQAGVVLPKGAEDLYRLIPDGQPYVDPYKDIQAAAMAIGCGLSTWESEIGKRGGDRTDVWKQLAKERDDAASLGLVLDLSGTNAPAPQSTADIDPAADTTATADTTAPADAAARRVPSVVIHAPPADLRPVADAVASVLRHATQTAPVINFTVPTRAPQQIVRDADGRITGIKDHTP